MQLGIIRVLSLETKEVSKMFPEIFSVEKYCDNRKAS
jgi:hypothetical protein